MCGSTRGRCPTRRCTTRSRTTTGSMSTRPPTSSSSTSVRPAAGSTSCTCSRVPCSTARPSPACPVTASCWVRTGRRCRSRCATTPMYRRSSTAMGRTRCAGSSCRARCCAAATSSSPRKASVRESASSCCRCGTPGTSSPPTPTPLPVPMAPATRRRGAPTRPMCSTATSWRFLETWLPVSLPTSRYWTRRALPRSSAISPRRLPTGTSAVRATDSGRASPTTRVPARRSTPCTRSSRPSLAWLRR